MKHAYLNPPHHGLGGSEDPFAVLELPRGVGGVVADQEPGIAHALEAFDDQPVVGHVNGDDSCLHFLIRPMSKVPTYAPYWSYAVAVPENELP